MKALWQYFPVALFIMLYTVVLTFESVDEFLKCDRSSMITDYRRAFYRSFIVKLCYFSTQIRTQSYQIVKIPHFGRKGRNKPT